MIALGTMEPILEEMRESLSQGELMSNREQPLPHGSTRR